MRCFPWTGKASFRNGNEGIFLYSSDTGETTEFEGIEAETVLSLALSEDAKTAAVTVGQKGRKDGDLYLFRKERPKKNSEDTYAVAISNGAERMYCLEYVDGELTGEAAFCSERQGFRYQHQCVALF